MENFLVEIVYEDVYGSYVACYADGTSIQLAAESYHDAVLEADMIEPYEYA
mgnify:CR=1 FL=1